MASHSGSSWGTVEETIDAFRSASPTPRSSSRLRSAAPSSSLVDVRTVAKRQCSISSSPRNVPKWVWVLPTSTTRSIAAHHANPRAPHGSRLGSRPMPARLYVVHGSHPCLTVEKALELKAMPYQKVELPASSQPLVMKALFGGRTVPGIKFAD